MDQDGNDSDAEDEGVRAKGRKRKSYGKASKRGKKRKRKGKRSGNH
jgi:hypothetical protein